METTNYRQFVAEYTNQIARFQQSGDIPGFFNPAAFAEKMTLGLVRGTAMNDGPACKATCKTLGIKSTYESIRSYLTA